MSAGLPTPEWVPGRIRYARVTLRPVPSSAKPSPPPVASSAGRQLLVHLGPLTAPRRTQALAELCDKLDHTSARYPGTELVLRYQVKPHPGTT